MLKFKYRCSECDGIEIVNCTSVYQANTLLVPCTMCTGFNPPVTSPPRCILVDEVKEAEAEVSSVDLAVCLEIVRDLALVMPCAESMEDCDAADFKDRAGTFFDLILRAREAVKGE